MLPALRRAWPVKGSGEGVSAHLGTGLRHPPRALPPPGCCPLPRRTTGEDPAQQALCPQVPQHQHRAQMAVELGGAQQDRPALLLRISLQQGPRPAGGPQGPLTGAPASGGPQPPLGPAVSTFPRPKAHPAPVALETLDGTCPRGCRRCHHLTVGLATSPVLTQPGIVAPAVLGNAHFSAWSNSPCPEWMVQAPVLWEKRRGKPEGGSGSASGSDPLCVLHAHHPGHLCPWLRQSPAGGP